MSDKQVLICIKMFTKSRKSMVSKKVNQANKLRNTLPDYYKEKPTGFQSKIIHTKIFINIIWCMSFQSKLSTLY